MNTVCLIGRLTNTPELRTTTAGKAVTSFALAVRRTKDITYFIDCVAWDKQAEFICRHFEKGSQLAVRGHLTTRMYEDSSGKKRKATEIVVDEVSFAGEKKADSSEPAPSYATAGDFKDIPDGEDLPF